MLHLKPKPIDFALSMQAEQRVQLQTLGIEHLAEVHAIENLCFETGWSKRLLELELENELALVRGVFVEGRLIAHSFSHVVLDELHILNIAVLPEFRSQRVGTVLFRDVLLTAVSRGVKFATLEARPGNTAAIALYSAQGFLPVRVRKAYYRDTGEDAVVYERHFV